MLRGAGRFVDDIPHPHALHVSFARSPVAAGTVTAVDVEAARAMRGVVGVFTSEDLGHPALVAALDRPEFVSTSMPLLAHDRVRYAGEPVVAVLAEDRYVAEDAAEAVWVQIDEHPAVTDLRQLDEPSQGPPLHDAAPDGVLVDLQMYSDALLEEVLATAPLVLEETFRSGRVAAAQLEPRTCLA